MKTSIIDGKIELSAERESENVILERIVCDGPKCTGVKVAESNTIGFSRSERSGDMLAIQITSKMILIAGLAFASVANAQTITLPHPFRHFFQHFQQRLHPHPPPQPIVVPDQNPAPAPDVSPVPDVAPAPAPSPASGIVFYVVVPSLTIQGADLAKIERSEAVRVAVGTNRFIWCDPATGPIAVLSKITTKLPAMVAVDYSIPGIVAQDPLTTEAALIEFIKCSTKAPPAPPIPAPPAGTMPERVPRENPASIMLPIPAPPVPEKK